MDCHANKVIGTENVHKKEVNVASNMLESFGVKKTFDHIVSNHGKKSCETITTDLDNKTYAQAKKAGIQTTRQYDARHSIKNLVKI